MDHRGYGFARYASGSIFADVEGAHNCPDSETQTTPSPISGQPVATTKRSRSVNYTMEEDKMLISAWINISMDPVQGNENRKTKYWDRVTQFYNQYKNFELERTASSLMHRWSLIQLGTNKFCGCFAQIEARHQSGVTEMNKIQDAKVLYRSLQKADFPFEHCWNELQFQPKWLEDCQNKKPERKGKNIISSIESSPTTPDTSSNGEDSSFVDIERPIGRKAEKARLKRKGKCRGDEDNEHQMYELFKEMKYEKKHHNDKKIEIMEKTYHQEQERMAYEQERIRVDKERLLHEQEKLRVEQAKFQSAEEERIMLIDTTMMPPMQAEYYRRRQREILARGAQWN